MVIKNMDLVALTKLQVLNLNRLLEGRMSKRDYCIATNAIIEEKEKLLNISIAGYRIMRKVEI